MRDLREEFERLSGEALAAAASKYLIEHSQDMSKEEAAYVLENYARGSVNLPRFSNGGVADYTGVAMLHGRKNAPETIFNANDSAKLYELVHNTPNLMADMVNKAVKINNVNPAASSTNTVINNTVHVDKVVTDNPKDFTNQMDKYFRTKLTESYAQK